MVKIKTLSEIISFVTSGSVCSFLVHLIQSRFVS